MENREKKRAFREAQLQEQKRIDEAVDMFHQSEKERAKQMAEARLEHRKTLNRDLAERAKRNEERRKLEEYEDHKRKVFNDAKRVSLIEQNKSANSLWAVISQSHLTVVSHKSVSSHCGQSYVSLISLWAVISQSHLTVGSHKSVSSHCGQS